MDACQGWDFDLYLFHPTSTTLIGLGNNGDLLTTPFAIWPRDSFDGLQPLETAVIGSAAANGIYRLFVDKWSTSGTEFNHSWTGSGVQAQIFNGPALLATVAPPPTCAANRFWHVGNLNKTSATTYTFTPLNTCSNTPPL